MKKLKIYMMTDQEGVSGVSEFDDQRNPTVATVARRQEWRTLLTCEVNAAIEGAYAGGATEILVDDAHGGNAIDMLQLDPRVRILRGRERPIWCAGLDETFDAMFSLGAHAMAGTRGGVLYHTWDAHIRQIRLCGVSIGEIGLEAFAAGAYGLPLIYVTGDTAACREAEALIPNITTVAVKHGLSRYCEIAYSPPKAREMVAEGARRAVANLSNVKPFLPAPPYTWQLDQYPDVDDCLKSNPADMPDTWTTIEDIRADSPLELIRKAWSKEV